MASVVQAEKLLTAEEYGRLPDNGKRTELVRGRIVELNIPYQRHGQILVNIARIIGRYLDKKDVGHLIGGDAAIRTERGPDTVRGADVAFISYKRRPKGKLPRAAYIDEAPELVFEVRSPSDRWSKVISKSGEYLEAGVKYVCVLDEQTQTARIYTADAPERVVAAEKKLTFPDLLPGFAVQVKQFFE